MVEKGEGEGTAGGNGWGGREVMEGKVLLGSISWGITMLCPFTKMSVVIMRQTSLRSYAYNKMHFLTLN